MSRVQMRKRASAIRSDLVRMSRNGWASSTAADYQPLEAELRTLDNALRPKSQKLRGEP